MMASSGKTLVKSKSGLRMVSVEAKDESPFLLQEPHWIPDRECATCLKCDQKFDMLTRKHHCRRCGQCFCSGCCVEKVLLPRMGFVDPVRLCHDCVDVTRKENEFYSKHLKLLITGTFLLLSGGDVVGQSSYCQLTNSHREILFSRDKPEKTNPTVEWIHDPVSVETIQDVVVQNSHNEIHGAMMPKSLRIKYKYIDEVRELTLAIPVDGASKQSMAWIKAMEKAFRLLQSSTGPS